jgi:hypothetical protein
VGRRRHPLAVLGLSVITLGGYLVVWHNRINHELSNFDARIDVRPGRSTFAVLLPWFAGFAASIAGAVLLALRLSNHAVDAVSQPVTIGLCAGLAVTGMLVLFFPPAIVAITMTLERLRLVEERVGMGNELQLRPVRRLVVLSIPLFGVFAYIVGVQRRLNAIWATVVPRIARTR